MKKENTSTLLCRMFEKGASSVAEKHGIREMSAKRISDELLKEARDRYNYEDDDNEEDTFWNRNKKWIIPALVGSAAFYIGADSERHGRADRSYLSNAINRPLERLKVLLGYNLDPLTKSMVDTKGYTNE